MKDDSPAAHPRGRVETGRLAKALIDKLEKDEERFEREMGGRDVI